MFTLLLFLYSVYLSLYSLTGKSKTATLLLTMEYRPAQKPKKTKGGQELSIIMAIIGLSVVLSGGFYLRNQPGPPLSATPGHGILCCDTGSGQACKPQNDPSHPLLTYNDPVNGPVQYGLLKSGVTFNDCGKHMRDSGQQFMGNPIVLDVSNEYNSTPGTDECGPLNSDTLADYRYGPKQCFPIPNDELVYVCVANCTAHSNPSCDPIVNPKNFYGDGTTVFNVYYRMADYGVARTSPDVTDNGVPDLVKNCMVPHCAWNPNDNKQNPNAGCGTGPTNGASPIVSPTAVQFVLTPIPYPTHHSEQLHTFEFGYPPASGPQQWIRPWCKPAVYLYPPRKENIHVSVTLSGHMLSSIPSYPPGGWEVTADQKSVITYKNATYPYLYYEAAIPDNLLPKNPDTGYVVAFDHLEAFFIKQLPKLGLNADESMDFSHYWLKALPKANYYKITLVPQDVLDAIAPLSISPKPDSILRVSLNFQPLDTKISLPEPVLPLLTPRGVFSVTEWGGLYKKDPNHTFTCLQ